MMSVHMCLFSLVNLNVFVVFAHFLIRLLGFLSVFLSCSFFLSFTLQFQEFFIHSRVLCQIQGSQILFSSLQLVFLPFLKVTEPKDLNFDEVLFINFFLYGFYAFGVMAKNFLLSSRSRRFSLRFSLKKFYSFMFYIQIDDLLGVNSCLQSKVQVEVNFCGEGGVHRYSIVLIPLLKRYTVFAPLSRIIWLHLCGPNSGFSILLH